MEDDYYYYDEENNYAYDDEVAASSSTDGNQTVQSVLAHDKALTAIFRSETVRSIEPNMVYDHLLLEADQAASVFHLSRQFVLLLLRRYRFHLETASEAFAMNPEENYTFLRVAEPIARAQNNAFLDVDSYTAGSAAGTSEPPSCPLCCFEDGDAEGNKLYALSNCGHFFCIDCWGDFVRQRLISDGNSMLTLRCMSAGCKQLVDTSELMKLLSDVVDAKVLPNSVPDSKAPDGESCEGELLSLAQRVRRSVLSEYIDGTARLNWCANPVGCDRILFCPLTGFSTPKLMCPDCGFPFCGKCKLAAHAPASCAVMQEWVTNIQLDGASIARILKDTKACPKCHNRIEKNMGCNHMTCRCSHQFCWICMGDWSAHTNNAYNCRAKPSESPVEETDSQRKNRIFFAYYQGYDAHISSMRSEAKQITIARRKIPLICFKQEEFHDVRISVAQLGNVLDTMAKTLQLARLTLAATYVQAHALTVMNEKENKLLEHQRCLLMLVTEELNKCLAPLTTASPEKLDLINIEPLVERANKLVDVFYE